MQKKSLSKHDAAGNGAVLSLLNRDSSDTVLLEALKRTHPGAKRIFFQRYSDHVQRVLVRIMGVDDAIPELISETFLQAFSGIASVRNGASLKAWISMIAVFTARGCIRKRKRRRIFNLLEPHKLQDLQTFETNTDAREALTVLYEILTEMPADERIAFALRFVDGMPLQEVANACNVSLATIKRRLARAQKLFVPMAKEDPLLRKWIERGERWSGQ